MLSVCIIWIIFYSLKLWQRLSSFSIHNGIIIPEKFLSAFAWSRTHAMQALTNTATAPNTAASGVFTIVLPRQPQKRLFKQRL